ncbi:MAG: carbon-nitrogen hydrolase family protein, partial [Campylobacteraceae bacterium]|nr:carbon-nitrogen hydrolase family protein [Campylobacteraceae bacterium]
NDEDKYFQAGNTDDFKIIEIDGLTIASLICFELRFLNLWEKFKGADIIIVPSMWGILRKQNFESLTNSLAIMNQCYVVASDSSNDTMASSSGIITPFGDEVRDDNKELISMLYDKKEIRKMRRYLNIGI